VTKDSRKICFVIMGFGKKTDYETGRTLDLDATYQSIILPAAMDQRLRCIRADEIMHSGVIDSEMYDMLLRADLVIADISTGNVNAVYELGVRHALRPNSTIIMKEQEGRLYFDLSHTNTFEYEHLGKDIGAREAERAKLDLKRLISEVMAAQKPDSPVYTFLPTLQQPRLSDQQYADLLDDTEAVQARLSGYMFEGELAVRDSRFDDAVRAFTAAVEMKRGEPYLLQQLALATYKSAKPSQLEALIIGLRIIEQLDPDHSNDPETLGIAGAIRKRLWLLTKDLVQLDAAIKYYARGFEVRRDYYNGENLASCYDFRAEIQVDAAEAQYDRMSARKVRLTLLDVLTDVVGSPSFAERSDRRWVLATLANCSFGVGRIADGEKYEIAFLGEKPANWEIETYNDGKRAVLR
jgi:hypothetical protein